MATLMNQSEVESEPAEKWKVAELEKEETAPAGLVGGRGSPGRAEHRGSRRSHGANLPARAC